MDGIVLELQRDALDQSVRLTDLLRKALLVAKKLEIQEFEIWISRELDGYVNIENKAVPPYRMAHGNVVARDPDQGWIPVIFKHSEKAEYMSRMPFIQPISELEDLYQSGEKDSSLIMSYHPSVESRFMDSVGRRTPPALEVQRSALFRVLDAVRTIVLNWALRLEKDGIIGTGLSFSDREKKVAHDMSYNTNNFFGNVSQSAIQLGTKSSIQTVAITADSAAAIRLFATALKQSIPTLKASESRIRELEAELKTLESQMESPQPKSSIVYEALRSIRSILESAAGSAAGQLLIQLGNILA